MDDAIFLQKAKELAKRNLQEDAVDKTSVSKGCRSIQGDYLKQFKSSD